MFNIEKRFEGRREREEGGREKRKNRISAKGR
jgi:hypothetical protein